MNFNRHGQNFVPFPCKLISFRNDREVLSYLTDSGKIKQLQYSTAAKMEWNRRLIKEERDAGIFCPTVSYRNKNYKIIIKCFYRENLNSELLLLGM